MPDIWPASPGFSSQAPATNDPVLFDKSVNGKEHSRVIASQFWSFTAEYPPMTRSQFAPILGFMTGLQGRSTPFQIVPPIIASPLGDVVGSTPVADGAAQTGRDINIRGCKISTTVLKAGDFCKFSGGDKVYMCRTDAVSDVNGDMILYLNTPLRAIPADGESLVVENVPFTMVKVGPVHEFPQDENGHFISFRVAMEEAIS